MTTTIPVVDKYGDGSWLVEDLEHEQVIALEWLRGGVPPEVRTLGIGRCPAESIALVEHFFELGAVEVSAFCLCSIKMTSSPNALIIEMPADPASRAAIISWINVSAVHDGIMAVEDTGQRFQAHFVDFHLCNCGSDEETDDDDFNDD